MSRCRLSKSFFDVNVCPHESSSAALSWIFSAIQRLWKNSIAQQILQIPFGRAFCLPGPEKPACAAFVRIELRLNKMSQVIFVIGRESSDGA